MYSSFCIFTFCLSLAVFTARADLSDETSREIERCRHDESKNWTYRTDLWNGPDSWGHMYPACIGLSQSPIEIISCKVSRDHYFPKAAFAFSSFTPLDKPIIRNNGYDISVIPNDYYHRWAYIGYDWFQFQSAHFHWGKDKDSGSEHIIDGQSYAMEIHLVYRNYNNHTIVVAIFGEERHDFTHPELHHVVNALPKVMYKDTNTTYPYYINILNFLPENPASFYAYAGSLTTPPCTEERVEWILLKVPILVGHDQLQEFRRVYSSPQNVTETGCKLSGNIRPVQPLHNRVVYSSYLTEDEGSTTPEPE